MVEDAVLRALEDSGKAPCSRARAAASPRTHKLVMDLRRFESDYDGDATPNATIEVNAKLLHLPA